jgi:hypothetical protein
MSLGGDKPQPSHSTDLFYKEATAHLLHHFLSQPQRQSKNPKLTIMPTCLTLYQVSTILLSPLSPGGQHCMSTSERADLWFLSKKHQVSNSVKDGSLPTSVGKEKKKSSKTCTF